MKTFLYAKIPLWIILILFFAVIILALAGFRITYSPELENSWSAISAVAAWAGVAATVVAIIVAVQIPNRIAAYQNKVALFDKRYEFYGILFQCLVFSELISQYAEKGKLSVKAMHICFISAFTDVLIKDGIEEALKYEKISIIMNVEAVLQKGSFLFDFDESMKDELKRMEGALSELINNQDNLAKVDVSKYIEAANTVEKEIVPKVEEILSLSREDYKVNL